MLGREIGAPLALGQRGERVVGLRHVRVQAPRAFEQGARACEVAALELDEAEVDERFDETRAVLERDAEVRVRGLEVALRERLHASRVQRRRGWRQGYAGRAADQSKQEQRAHGPASVSGWTRFRPVP